jgi:hypothetical protein
MSSSSDSSDKYSNGLCQMRKINGDPCTSPAQEGERFCHFHKVMGPSPIDYEHRPTSYDHIYLPRLKDAHSIQAAISEVCELMLHRRIEPKEASALFYAMQVASQNLGPFNVNRSPNAYAAAPNSQTPASETEVSGTPISETTTPTANSAATPDPLPPGTIQGCAESAPRRRPGRPRKAAPQLVRSK